MDLQRHSFTLLTLALLSIVFVACGDKQAEQADGKLRIVATTGMIGDAVRVIAGDRVELHTMMGPGVDPHLYKATKGDLDRLDKADVVFYNGLHLEAKLGTLLERMARTKKVVAVAESVPDSQLHLPDGSQGYADPHIWFDVSLWRMAVAEVGRALAEADTGNAAVYADAVKMFDDSLAALHQWTLEQVGAIPPEQRVLVTAHDAFGYFGTACDMEVVGLQGMSTVSEAGLYDVTSLVDMIVQRKIRAVFVESSVSSKAIESVVRGCRERGHDVTIGGELFSDAMGAADTPEGTYLGIIRHNVNTIVSALK
jgi:manganese/zinc/iron transport system substrate-binding protein